MTCTNRDLVEQQSAEFLLRPRTKDFSANLLRVIEGAGNPSELPQQIAELADTLEIYREAFGRDPTAADFENAIGLASTAKNEAFEIATTKMVQGSLEIAASRILAQEASEITGKMKLFEGILCRERAMKSLWNEMNS